ncbi:peptidoglycan DD-metalloendopeptidase family protein [Aestuariivirga sp.]|uniref:murein hydrolase activator EnvC family protein n=1 Tax=Aestuariivirga sp. TaxID=2650926 RepID=UPI0025C63AAC|nr:peptidoglycan DD-metalloendopeptidase family protein [Aestuariivirga sp.]MCA3554739.1 peptidoglycan DD-metalloendopeptidase family protein [Aestuariivirga sp.]
MALLALTPVFRGGSAHAQEQQQLDTLSQQIESGRANEARIAGEIAAAVQAQDAIAAKLSAIAQSIQSQENAVARSEGDLAKLRQDRAMILTALGEKQDVLSELLAGLQRLEQNPPPALVVDPGDILSALRGAMLLGTIAPELQDEARDLAAKLDKLKELEASITTRKDDVARDLARLTGERAALKDLVTQKKALVSQGTADLEAERRRTAELAEKARSLKQLLANLDAQRQQQEAAKAAEQRQREQQEALLRQPRVAFPDARGKLAFPAQGSIVRRFGEPDGLGRETQGLMIATGANAQVTTPADGKVEFAGPFRSYGQVVILNPGGGYRVLLAGMDKITASVGEFLRAGEPVGEMGSGPASVTLFGDVAPDGRPVLYIEFRDGTEAINSGPWWIGGLKEASG